MVLIDTSVWLFALKKKPHPEMRKRIDSLLLESEIAINGIIKLELLGGTRTEKEYNRLKTRLDSLYYIESTESLWDLASMIAFKLKRKGVTVPYTDIFISASAIANNALLIHADSHFELIKKHTDLKTENLMGLL